MTMLCDSMIAAAFRLLSIILQEVYTRCCVPISPESVIALRSMDSAREWQPPTAARFLPAAGQKAELSCPPKEPWLHHTA